MRLPGETHLLAGHGSPSTLRRELETNPYVVEAIESER
jgi:hypothetical protein